MSPGSCYSSASMGRRTTELRFLARFRENEAKERILAAYQETGGNAVQAAQRLGIGHRTLMTLVGELSLQGAIQAIREASGTPDRTGTTGRPPGYPKPAKGS